MTDLAGLIERLEDAISGDPFGFPDTGDEVTISLQDARDILAALRALQASTGEGGRVSREPVTTKIELDVLDKAEVVEGYFDGLAGEPEPGDNRSQAYWHGWRNGTSDRTGKTDAAQLALIRDIKAEAPSNA